MNLINKKCKPCEGGVPPLNKQEVDIYIQSTPEWSVSEANNKISRSFSFQNFIKTMKFVNAVAEIAENQQHHPDIECGYNYCRVHFMTHSVGGLSENDFICAAQIDNITK
jgi:4a-hydroxytetrahydrobiopterin dehydratase